MFSVRGEIQRVKRWRKKKKKAHKKTSHQTYPENTINLGHLISEKV